MTKRRLTPLLNLHRLRRRVLKQLLASLRAQLAELGLRLRDLGEEWMRVRAWNADSLARAGGMDQVRLGEDWIRGAELQAEELRRRMADVAEQAKDAERRLIKASQELKMLSTLEERRRKRELAEAARREQRDLDEMASNKVGVAS
jgi:flagellar export protein FliJ